MTSSEHVRLDDVPTPRQPVTDKKALVLRDALENLFQDYEADDELALRLSGGSASYCRSRALYFATTGKVQLSAFFACDTGVPNDEIFAVYALLFL